jgi:hypothetical protein
MRGWGTFGVCSLARRSACWCAGRSAPVTWDPIRSSTAPWRWSIADLTIFRHGDPAHNDVNYWAVTVTPPVPVQDVEVELLGAARPGWRITSRENAGPLSATGRQWLELTSFEPGYHYELDASKAGPEGSAAPAVVFTTDDFARIGDGQVLAPIDHEKSEVVARQSFVKAACAKKGPGGSL